MTAVSVGAPGSGTGADLQQLRRVLVETGPVVVAFSGGADSAFLAWMARRTLGRERAHCVTAVSPSLATSERADCRALASEWDLDWREVRTAELEDPAYVANRADRCAHCKTALMEVLVPIAAERGATAVLGVNRDDLGDHRPGQAAASDRGARFPLVEAGFTKADVRAWSRRLGLRTWDKPAAACLASRLPYGTPVTVERLHAVEEAESALRRMGLRQVRVRHHGSTARIEVPEEELGTVLRQRQRVVRELRAAGYSYVTLDLEGFRSGSLNRELAPPVA